MPSILSQKAMIARCRVSMWSGRAYDAEISTEAAKRHNAAADSIRANKMLVDKAALAPVVSAAGALRREFITRTLPWEDDGARLLSAAGYQPFMDAMNPLRDAFTAAAEDFINGYDAHVAAAENRLGSAFVSKDYPTRGAISRRFSASFAMSPVGDADDFRVSIGDAQADAIRADIEARSKATLDAAMGDIADRIADTVGHMAERLSSYKPGRIGERAENTFKASLVDNVRDLASLIPMLNVTSDPRIAALAERMARELVNYDADELRGRDRVRAEVATAAASIAQDAKAIFAHVSDFAA